MRILAILIICFVVGGCDVIDFFQCGDAGVKDCKGLFCLKAVCNGE